MGARPQSRELLLLPTDQPSGVTATVIKPTRGWRALDVRELWLYRELLYFFAWRDIKVRYKQAALGIVWALVQPLATMVVFTVFFGRLAAIPSDGLPYELFSLAALVPWTFFANGVAHSAQSLVSAQNMIKKVYFPRIAIPIASVVAGLVDFALSFSILVALLLAYGVVPTTYVLLVPALLLLAFLSALGVGLWLAALNVYYRDVQYIVPFLLQIWLFLTPVAYPSSLIEEPWRTLYALNPMAGVVEGFRWVLLAGINEGSGHAAFPGAMMAVSLVVALIILGSGAFFFRRLERTFADFV